MCATADLTAVVVPTTATVVVPATAAVSAAAAVSAVVAAAAGAPHHHWSNLLQQAGQHLPPPPLARWKELGQRDCNCNVTGVPNVPRQDKTSVVRLRLWSRGGGGGGTAGRGLGRGGAWRASDTWAYRLAVGFCQGG
ncbi:unnamed protein product [Closterium sp. NIES-54]